MATKPWPRRCSGIDMIIGGNTRKLMPQPERVGDTLIIQQGYLGEWVGVLHVSYAQGKPAQTEVNVISLTPDYRDDPDVATLVRKYAELYPTPTVTPPLGLENPTATPAK